MTLETNSSSAQCCTSFLICSLVFSDDKMTLWRPFLLHWLNKNGYCSAPSWVLRVKGNRAAIQSASCCCLCASWLSTPEVWTVVSGSWSECFGSCWSSGFFTISVPRVYSVWWKTKTIQWGNNLLRRGTEVRLLGADKKAALTQWTAFCKCHEKQLNTNLEMESAEQQKTVSD